MTKYNKHKTAFKDSLGGWYLFPRGEKTRRKLLGSHPQWVYLGKYDEEVEDITPEIREILLDAEEDGSFTQVWMEFQTPYRNDRYWLAQEHIKRIRDLG